MSQQTQDRQQTRRLIEAIHPVTGKVIRLGPYTSDYSVGAVVNALTRLDITFTSRTLEEGQTQ